MRRGHLDTALLGALLEVIEARALADVFVAARHVDAVERDLGSTLHNR